MEPITEEVPKNESSSTLTNGSIPSDKPEISSKTPLLSVSSPDDELSEKLTKFSSTPVYHRGFSDPNINKLDGDNEVPLVPVLDLPGPPDGGWGWVICFASFMCNFITDGVVYSYGVLLPHLVNEFESTNSAVSWAGSLVPGLYMGAGPIVGGLVNKFGCRPVCMVGGVVACISLVLSTFVTSVPLLMLTYGLMGGFGFGMVYLPSVVSVGYYFEKKRALATGIAVCGSGVGCFAFAPLANVLVENTGWKWTNRTFGGFAIVCSLMGALMRPLQLISKPQQKEENLGSRRESNFSDVSIGNPSNLLNPVKTGFFTVDEILEEEDENDHSSSSRSRTISQKTEEDKFGSKEIPCSEKDYHKTSNKNINADSSEETKKANLISRGLTNITTTIRSRHISIQDPSSTSPNIDSTNESNRDTFMRTMLRQNSLSHAPNATVLQPNSTTMRKNVSTPQNIGRLTRLSSNASFAFPNEKRDSTANLVYGVTDGTELFLQPRSAIEQIRRPSHAPILRPLSRKDIFYSGSIFNINLPPPLPDGPPPNKFGDEDIDDNMDMPDTLNRYRHSIISIPKFKTGLHRGSIVTSHLDIEPAVIGKKDGLLDEKYEITRPLISILKEMMDFASYMCNPIFLMVAISNILGFLAVYIPYIYLPDMMKTGRNIEAAKASFVISLIGVSNTLGRIVLGALVDYVPWNNTALVVTNICLVLSGVCVLSFPFCFSYPAFVIVSLLLGLFVSGYISLTSIVLVDLLGIDSLTSTFGLLVLFRGIASILGPPLGGLVYESSNKDYDATFYMAGALFIGAGIISELAHVIYLVKEKRRQNKEGGRLTKI